MHLTYNKGRGSSSSSAHVCIIKEVYSAIGSKTCRLPLSNHEDYPSPHFTSSMSEKTMIGNEKHTISNIESGYAPPRFLLKSALPYK